MTIENASNADLLVTGARPRIDPAQVLEQAIEDLAATKEAVEGADDLIANKRREREAIDKDIRDLRAKAKADRAAVRELESVISHMERIVARRAEDAEDDPEPEGTTTDVTPEPEVEPGTVVVEEDAAGNLVGHVEPEPPAAPPAFTPS